MASSRSPFPRPLAAFLFFTGVAVVTLVGAALRSGARGIPIPPRAVGLVGDWTGDGVRLRVSRDGIVREEYVKPGERWWMQGRLTAVAGDTLVVDVLVRTRRLVVQEWPHPVGAGWTAVINGRRVARLAVARPAA